MSSTTSIETRQLRKEYGEKVAVQGLTLQVMRGEVFGFLGPNGAGKTTSIKMLLGLAAPTSGTAELLGRPLGDRASRARIGFLPEHFRFHEWLTAGEFLTMHGQLYGMERTRIQKRTSELLEQMGLAPFRGKQLRTFSKGMLQRVGLAQALINEPELVLLDEPTSGLDPIGRRLVRDIIHELRRQGTCVFLNSHLLSEIEVTCDRVAFIRHGEVLRTLDLKTMGEGKVVVTIRLGGWKESMLEGLKLLAQDAQVEGETLTMSVVDEKALPQVVRSLVEQGADIYSVAPQRISLEDLFIEIVGKEGSL